MKRVELDQRTDEWKKWREEGVTATESRVIMRRDEWKTPFALWLEKTHRADPPDLSGNPAVRRGVKYEDRARTVFEASLGEPVLPESCAESDENLIFRASFDGLTLDNIPVEIKCPMEGTWNDVRTNGINSRAYKSYWVQVQHQMYVAAAPYAWLVFWNDDELQTFRVDRDQAFIDEMVKAGLAFHECVVKDVPPEIDEELDTFIPKGDEAVGAWVRVAADFVQIDAQVKKLEEELKRLSGVKKTLTDSLCEQMGSFRRADFAGVSVTKGLAKGTVDWKKVCEHLTGKAPEDADWANYRRADNFRVTVRVTGRDLPKNMTDEAARADIACAKEPAFNGWF